MPERNIIDENELINADILVILSTSEGTQPDEYEEGYFNDGLTAYKMLAPKTMTFAQIVKKFPKVELIIVENIGREGSNSANVYRYNDYNDKKWEKLNT